MLEAAGLACERGGRTLFRELSFALADGQGLRIAGPNGSGKTSLMRILCGLLAPAAGEVRWMGERIARLAEDYHRSLVYIGHAPAVSRLEELMARHVRAGGALVYTTHQASALDRDSRLIELG